jgi:hypothetical protein
VDGNESITLTIDYARESLLELVNHAEVDARGSEGLPFQDLDDEVEGGRYLSQDS